MNKYEVTGDLVLTSTLELLHYLFSDPHCNGSSSSGQLPQGRITLPIFEELFPAGSTVFSGDVIPFNVGPPTTWCGQEYVRRINVTLFNAGLVPATFTVKAHRNRTSSPEFAFSATYEIPAQSVRQFNSVYSPPHQQDEVGNHDANLWFAITADQPFLSYVSTVFDDGQPGAIQYEIFPSKLR